MRCPRPMNDLGMERHDRYAILKVSEHVDQIIGPIAKDVIGRTQQGKNGARGDPVIFKVRIIIQGPTHRQFHQPCRLAKMYGAFWGEAIAPARKERRVISAHQATIVEQAQLQHDIDGGGRQIPGRGATPLWRLTRQVGHQVKGPAKHVSLLLLAQLSHMFMQVAVQSDLMAGLDHLFTLGAIGFDGMPWNKPRAWDTIVGEQMYDAWHRNGAELSTGERGRRRLATIDPQGEGIEIKGETDSTSHSNADTVGPSPVPEKERKLCPPFFWASQLAGSCYAHHSI